MTPEASTAAWIDEPGRRWLEDQECIDRSAAFGEAALERARPAPAERVVDVGCGAGVTLLPLASAVGATGRVLGVDVSAAMVERARARVSGLAQVELVQADAGTHRFEERYDLVFSRMGVMFFRDPVAAFANLRRSLRAGGRLAFACWRSLADNPWLGVPYSSAAAVAGTDWSPDGTGMLSFADPLLVESVLAAAGFAEIAIAACEADYVLSDSGLADAVRLSTRRGPTAPLLARLDSGRRAEAEAAIGAALEPHLRGDRVVLPGAAWIVSAT